MNFKSEDGNNNHNAFMAEQEKRQNEAEMYHDFIVKKVGSSKNTTRVPVALIIDAELSAMSVRVASYLYSIQEKGTFDKKDISILLGISEQDVELSTNELDENGWMTFSRYGGVDYFTLKKQKK